MILTELHQALLLAGGLILMMILLIAFRPKRKPINLRHKAKAQAETRLQGILDLPESEAVAALRAIRDTYQEKLRLIQLMENDEAFQKIL